MSEKQMETQEDETPTLKKLRALVRDVGRGTIAYETVIPQAIITFLILGGAIFLVVTNREVPGWLLSASGLIIGFYFGSDYEFRKMTGKAKGHV
jgi:hypothetical protein